LGDGGGRRTVAAHPRRTQTRPKDIAITSRDIATAELLRIVAGVDAEIKRFISAHVSRRRSTARSRKAKIIDIGGQIASVWQGP